MDKITWTLEDDRLAALEGWGIFDNSDHGLRIERRDDINIFQNDEDAYEHVLRQSAAGSVLHMRAMQFLYPER